MRSFIIYRVTNQVNGKAYIGRTTLGLAKRWALHLSNSKKKRAGHPLALAILKYGSGAFVVEHVASAQSWSDLLAAEKMIIVQEGNFGEGYNVTAGGDGPTGFRMPPAAVEAQTARMNSLYAERRAQGLGGYRLGFKNSPEHRAKQSAGISAALDTPEHRARLRANTERARASGKHGNSRKLTEGQVFAMRVAKVVGVALRPVAVELGVPYEIARRAATGQTYQSFGTAGG